MWKESIATLPGVHQSNYGDPRQVNPPPDSEQNPGSWRANIHSNVTVSPNENRTPEINKPKEQLTYVSKFHIVRLEEYGSSSTPAG